MSMLNTHGPVNCDQYGKNNLLEKKKQDFNGQIEPQQLTSLIVILTKTTLWASQCFSMWIFTGAWYLLYVFWYLIQDHWKCSFPPHYLG